MRDENVDVFPLYSLYVFLYSSYFFLIII
jgi:hypothetical protein